MQEKKDHEPVFVRSKWGTNRYVYNPRNPVGAALIVGSLLLFAGLMYYLHDSTNWGRGELRDAVHGAARALEAKPQRVGFLDDYESMIRQAIDETSEGPTPAGRSISVRVNRDDPQTTDTFEISAEDVADYVVSARVHRLFAMAAPSQGLSRPTCSHPPHCTSTLWGRRPGVSRHL
ncbi:hypothetical protein [Nonomuraea aridisoli]|uniref:Uncharacterized protein n=1 Tax=Nonomuraea aridisoli TaxID=2070368 RepID=A0A2W2D9X4_9ACTN|nr:hypothetical protein [Nonomuraea aridisoli]PZG07101.1 hypothetical protein C1J01_41465 [Nonomuraea aridisoli]